MRDAAPWALFCALVTGGGCSSPGIDVQLRVSPGQHPLAAVDRVWFSLRDSHGLTQAVQSASPSTSHLDLTGLQPDAGYVLALDGTDGTDVVAHGQSCPFDLVRGLPPPRVTVYFGLVEHFASTSPPALSRSGAVAVLADGAPLIAGGAVDAGPPLVRSERYDAVAGHFSEGPPLNAARVGAQAVALPDGAVLILGGAAPGAPAIELYSMGKLTPLASTFPSDWVDEATVVFSDGTVLVTGGQAASGPASATALLLSGDGAAVVPAGTMSAARARHTMTLVGGPPSAVALVIGGVGPSGPVGKIEVFDRTNGFQAAGASLMTPRSEHTTTELPGGKLLVAGGRGADGTPLASAELVDAVQRVVLPTGTLRTPRAQHTATRLPSGRILFTGGFGADGAASVDVEIFDPALGASGGFVAAQPLSTPRAGHAALPLCDGTILLVGGGAGAELYTP